MYCRHCGKEIEENSNFCKFCGKSQHNKQRKFIIKVFFIVWVISNFYLLMGKKSTWTGDVFYPFTNKEFTVEQNWEYGRTETYAYNNWDKDFYDFSEFIVYVFIFPTALYGINKLYNMKKNKRKLSLLFLSIMFLLYANIIYVIV